MKYIRIFFTAAFILLIFFSINNIYASEIIKKSGNNMNKYEKRVFDLNKKL